MKESLTTKLPGISLSALAALIATALASFSIGSFSLALIGAPVIAILGGMIIATIAPNFANSPRLKPGTTFASKKILQYAVIALGFTLNLAVVAVVGWTTLPIILVTIAAALLTAYIMMKVLHLDSKLACLLGVGSCICGGSAIAAAAPVIKANEKTVAQAVSVVFLFNVVAALIFPALGQILGLGSGGFAIFAGTAINDTSSVTAAAATAETLYGASGILSAAVTVKLTRTLAIIPIVVFLAFYTARKETALNSEGAGSARNAAKNAFPTFILFFIGASCVTTLIGMMDSSALADAYTALFIPAVSWLAKFFIAMAMFSIGLKTSLPELIKGDVAPIMAGFVCWIVIIIVSLSMQMLTGTYFIAV